MSTTKKILVIAGGTYVSGAEKVTLDVIEGFKEHGHKVHCMVSGWNDGDFIQRLQALDIPYTSIKLGWYYTSKIMWTLDSLVHYPKAIWDFICLRKNFKADVVYTISFRQIVLLYPFFKKNIVYHIHDPNSHSRQSKYFLNLIDRKVKKYIAVSNFIKKDLEKCGLAANKIEVVHNGVKFSQYNLIDKTYMSNGILKIGIVGQIIERKGHKDLLKALLKIKNKINFKLYIYGKGSIDFKNELIDFITKNELNEYVFWGGFVLNPQEIYNKIDCLVAPTKNEEPFALVALEAGYHQLPVIVTKSGGFPESIEDKITGFIVNKNSPDEIATFLEYFFNNPTELKKMGDNAFHRIASQFDLQKTKLNINQIIQEIN